MTVTFPENVDLNHVKGTSCFMDDFKKVKDQNSIINSSPTIPSSAVTSNKIQSPFNELINAIPNMNQPKLEPLPEPKEIPQAQVGYLEYLRDEDYKREATSSKIQTKVATESATNVDYLYQDEGNMPNYGQNSKSKPKAPPRKINQDAEERYLAQIKTV